MLTGQLFEQWNIDDTLVVDSVQSALGPCDIFLGGSLADDLGNLSSDLDLYCFLPPGSSSKIRSTAVSCGDTTLDLTAVPTDQDPGRESLLTLLLGPADASEGELPLLSNQRFHQLHALYRDRHLASSGHGEAFRRTFAADLLHIYMAVRSILACAALAEDLISLRNANDHETALHSARIAAEYAVDAALAVEGAIVVNPKWRSQLLARTRLKTALPPEAATSAGLYPRPERPDAIAACLQTADAHLRHAVADGLVGRFDLVQDAIRLLRKSHDLWR
ncbi:hypothetical protein [Streptomyces rubiginosohelvolus]|uniref:hypothetical protein n=1 Tax=Streptomyces rubiginosohelvolus TaxID=67362 RepID=UPI0035D5F972